MPLMHIVSLVHVRASEAFTITNSKHESYPTGSFYPVFVISPTSISPISKIRIQFNQSHSTHTLHSCFYSVYRPVGKVLHIAQMMNASNAHRESRSRKSIRGIHHHKLEA